MSQLTDGKAVSEQGGLSSVVACLHHGLCFGLRETGVMGCAWPVGRRGCSCPYSQWPETLRARPGPHRAAGREAACARALVPLELKLMTVQLLPPQTWTVRMTDAGSEPPLLEHIQGSSVLFSLNSFSDALKINIKKKKSVSQHFASEGQGHSGASMSLGPLC